MKFEIKDLVSLFILGALIWILWQSAEQKEDLKALRPYIEEKIYRNLEEHLDSQDRRLDTVRSYSITINNKILENAEDIEGASLPIMLDGRDTVIYSFRGLPSAKY